MANQQRRGRKIAMDKAELRGTAEVVGEVPRTGTPDPRLEEPELYTERKVAPADE